MSSDKSGEEIGDLEESKLPASIPATNEPQNAGPPPPKRFHFLTGGFRYNNELSKAKKEEHRREREKANGTPAKKFKESIRQRLRIPIPKSPLVTTITSMAGAPTPATFASGYYKPNAASQKRADHVPTAVAIQQISDDGDTRFLIIDSPSQKPAEEDTACPMGSTPPNDNHPAADDTVPLQRE
uniref:Uncharacterized protein n=1 Tax=Panagrolaimus davidi TaxID=227884 RepID=A0A914QAK9_9BILA